MSVGDRLEKIEEHQADCRERLARQEVMIGEIHGCMKPKNGPSFPVRLDRVERFQGGIIRTLWAVVMAAVTVTAGAVVTVFGLKG